MCRWTPWRKMGMISEIKGQAVALMNDPAVWSEVEALASALAKDMVLTGQQIEAIVRRSILPSG